MLLSPASVMAKAERPLAEGDMLEDHILNACAYLQPLCMWVILQHAERVPPFLKHPKTRTQVIKAFITC